MATLVIDQISKSFGDVEALKNVSFECQDGEFVVILGPSGAGKTTTLKCIAGIEYPERGTIYIDGEDVTMDSPQDRDVAMAFETYALYPQFTVYDNLAFPLRSPRYSEPEEVIDKRVHEVTNLLGIENFLHRLPNQLSQGQRQRVSVGRALVREPKLFLFDEPISHLDAKLKNAMRRELKRMRRDLGQTTVYVTHDYLEALSLADRVLVLYEGQVLQFDNVKDVYNSPAVVEVGQLFGDIPMMFFEGEISQQREFFVDGESFTLKTNNSSNQINPGRKVILGLRPTDIGLVSFDDGGIRGEVYSVQNQFGSKLVTVETGEHLVDVVVPFDVSIGEGDKAGVRVPSSKCFYFDSETHQAI